MAGTLRVVMTARKGGVGKSVVTVLLAHELASQGARVLVVDLDPQGPSSGKRLGADVTSPLAYSAVDLILGPKGRDFQPQIIVKGHLDVVPGNQSDLGALEYLLHSIHEERKLGLGPNPRRAILDSRLTALEMGYDFMLVDTPAFFGEITTNALEAAHIVLSPINMQAPGDVITVLDLLQHRAALERKAPVFFLPNRWDKRCKKLCSRSLQRAFDLVPERLVKEMVLPASGEVEDANEENRALASGSDTAVALRERVWKLGQVLMGREEGVGGLLAEMGEVARTQLGIADGLERRPHGVQTVGEVLA